MITAVYLRELRLLRLRRLRELRFLRLRELRLRRLLFAFPLPRRLRRDFFAPFFFALREARRLPPIIGLTAATEGVAEFILILSTAIFYKVGSRVLRILNYNKKKK